MASELDMAREKGYMNTSFHGYNAVFLYLGAWERGIPFDYEAAYEYLRKNAVDPKGPRGYLAEYIKQGWISDIVPDHNPSPPYAGGKRSEEHTSELQSLMRISYAVFCLKKKKKKNKNFN